MTKKYYVKHWRKLDKLYEAYRLNYEKLQKKPNDVELIKERLYLQKKIKWFLRYDAPHLKYYKRP